MLDAIWCKQTGILSSVRSLPLPFIFKCLISACAQLLNSDITTQYYYTINVFLYTYSSRIRSGLYNPWFTKSHYFYPGQEVLLSRIRSGLYYPWFTIPLLLSRLRNGLYNPWFTKFHDCYPREVVVCIILDSLNTITFIQDQKWIELPLIHYSITFIQDKNWLYYSWFTKSHYFYPGQEVVCIILDSLNSITFIQDKKWFVLPLIHYSITFIQDKKWLV